MAAREPFNVTAQRSVPSSSIGLQRSPWHSPIPYLFGGLAAMLGLIAFALLILACSYWKLSGYLGNENDDGERDLESGEGGGKIGENEKETIVFEEKILVIMAGDIKPTFLATPMSSRSSSFGGNSTKSCCCNEKNCEKLAENGEMVKQGNNEGEHTGRLEATPVTIRSGVDVAIEGSPDQRAVITDNNERHERIE